MGMSSLKRIRPEKRRPAEGWRCLPTACVLKADVELVRGLLSAVCQTSDTLFGATANVQTVCATAVARLVWLTAWPAPSMMLHACPVGTTYPSALLINRAGAATKRNMNFRTASASRTDRDEIRA